MLDHQFTADLLTYYRTYSNQRHHIIRESNDILRLAKQAIFAIHKNDREEADSLLTQASEKITALMAHQAESGQVVEPQGQGAFRAAIEEYFEARLFVNYIDGHEVGFLENFDATFYEEYLAGLCDVTGEIVRRAIREVTDKNYDNLSKYRDFIEDSVKVMMTFNLTGKLRSKYDDSLRNLKRMEQILYDVSLK